jgi:thymidylate synthase
MFEENYKKLLLNILFENDYKPNRTGYNTYSSFGKFLKHNINEGFPMLTSKKLYLKNFIHELIWIINGETNIKYLLDNKVIIWNKWADINGNLGPIYGYQLRNFNGEKDQLIETINNIKKDPYSRRHLISLWNPIQLNEMVLPPCHFAFQFYVTTNKKLNLNVFMRSCDAFIGLPYDFALYSALLLIIAKETNLQANEIQFNFTDLHIYENHLQGVIKYINNPKHNLPTLIYNGNINNLNINNFTLLNYKSEEFIKVDIAK